MKNAWVQDLTSFFETLGGTSRRTSFRKKKPSRVFKGGSNVEEISQHEAEGLLSPCAQTVLNTSDGSEHCFTVREAREMFEKMSSTDKADNSTVNKQRPPLKRQSSIFERLSGSAVANDSQPIRGSTCDGGVQVRKGAATASPSTDTHGQPDDRKKSVSKMPFPNVGRKSTFKKSGITYRMVTSEADVDRENDGVIIRMKNQESYYDGRAKYQSLLPEAPLCPPLFGDKKRRPSLGAQKATERSLDVVDRDCSRDRSYMNSILLHDISLPSADDSHNLFEKISQESEDNFEDLEPNEDYDLQSEIKVSQLISQGPQRIKWAETEEGKKLIAIMHLESDVVKWQEAQFEVITSEASYYRSLETLVHKIYKSPAMLCVGEKPQGSPTVTDLQDSGDGHNAPAPIMSALQKHHLFSNILEIHICSGELLKALETRWRENPFIEDLSDIVVEFSKDRLRPYITYLRNQQYQTSTYNALLTKSEFLAVVRNIESDIECGMLNLSSFLLLPMQRLLRLKLLFTVVKHYIPAGYPVQGCDSALVSLETLIKECSDQKILMEQKEVIMNIYNRLTFKQQTGVSIGNKPLLKDGQMKVSSSNDRASKSLRSSFIGRHNTKAQLYLFEDQLIIAKTRKLPLCLSSSDGREMVVDICPRSEVKFDASTSTRPLFFTKGPPGTNFKLVLDKGLKGSAEYMCEAGSSKALAEWKNVFCSQTNEWEQFEFNDVLVTRDYTPVSALELELRQGQILTITRRLNDGRAVATSGGRQGEIPLSHVQFVNSPQANPRLISEIRESISQKKID